MTSMGGRIDPHDHYLNGGVPTEIAENLKEFLPEHDGLSYEEVLLQQASVYQSFQEHGKNKGVATNDGHSSDWIHLLEEEGESSRQESAMSQEALDEALARSLQELEEEFDEFLLSEHSGGTESPIATPFGAQAVCPDSGQDEVDPDNMRYEELLGLAEAVGVENRGLSAKRISLLPTSKYKSGMFLKNKKKKDNCVICQMDFSSGEHLIILPCSHQYHTKCISQWLKLRKNCPICQKEVM